MTTPATAASAPTAQLARPLSCAELLALALALAELRTTVAVPEFVLEAVALAAATTGAVAEADAADEVTLEPEAEVDAEEERDADELVADEEEEMTPQSWRTSVRPMLISVALHCEPKQEPTFDGKSELTLQMQATSVEDEQPELVADESMQFVTQTGCC